MGVRPHEVECAGIRPNRVDMFRCLKLIAVIMSMAMSLPLTCRGEWMHVMDDEFNPICLAICIS